MMETEKYLWLGIDAGGTYCRVRLENDAGELLATGKAATGHPVHGMDVVAQNVLKATDMALRDAGLAAGNYDNIIAAGGYAGAHLHRFASLVENWMSPFVAHYVTTDLHTACYGGLDGNDGGVMIMGTGFSAMANVQGKSHFIGGQGFLLGDIACGGWIGLQAVRYALAFRDGMRPPSSIVKLVEDTYQAWGAELADKMIVAQPNEFARCSKGVFTAASAGDEQALAIVKQAARDAQEVVEKLVDLGCEQVAVCGSVGQRLRDYLPAQIERHLIAPKGSAEQGAIWFARQHWHKPATPPSSGKQHVA